MCVGSFVRVCEFEKRQGNKGKAARQITILTGVIQLAAQTPGGKPITGRSLKEGFPSHLVAEGLPHLVS